MYFIFDWSKLQEEREVTGELLTLTKSVFFPENSGFTVSGVPADILISLVSHSFSEVV